MEIEMQTTITRPSTGKVYTITTDHSASSYGIPVVLEDGELIDFREPRVVSPGNMSDSGSEWYDDLSPVDKAIADAAARMDSLHTGLCVGADGNPIAYAMVEAAWYGRSFSL